MQADQPYVSRAPHWDPARSSRGLDGLLRDRGSQRSFTNRDQFGNRVTSRAGRRSPPPVETRVQRSWLISIRRLNIASPQRRPEAGLPDAVPDSNAFGFGGSLPFFFLVIPATRNE